MVRWMRAAGFGTVIAAILCIGTQAAPVHYESTIQADGQSMGTATGTLDVSKEANGHFLWTLADSRFEAASRLHATVSLENGALVGTGSVAPAETISIKDFNATVAQSTGVDVTYRFRITATLADGAVRSVSIRQLK